MSEQKAKYDIIIIGAGPAGYTAGIYSSRARHNTLLISGILPGGQLMNTTDVENYPGFDQGIMGPDLMLTMRKQTERMGTKIIDDEVTSVDFKNNPLKVSTASNTFEANSVIVCTGANPRKIGLDGEQTFAGKASHIVQHVMAHFLKTKNSLLLVVAIQQWKRQLFSQNLHQQYISYIEEIHLEQVR